jgi:integrase
MRLAPHRLSESLPYAIRLYATHRLAEIGCDAFTIAQLLGHSDVRVTMRCVRTVEESKRAAVDAVQLNSRKNVHVLATWPKQPPLPAAVNG